MLCDGTFTCGLDDPFRLRNYGNVKNQSIAQILAGDAIGARRLRLLGGQDCGNCHLHNSVDTTNLNFLAPATPYPKTLVVESSIRCNIRCNNSICNIANDATMHVRDEDYLQFSTFKKAIDEIGPHLEELYFWNYGEPFINPKALDMLAYAKVINPEMRVASSTNGLLLDRGNLAERIVTESLVDWLCFTIGGSDEESYALYHKSSSFDKAMGGMRKVVDAKRQHGSSLPLVHWRYLLFSWNDSDEQIAEARRLADDIGVDEFQIFMTSAPLEGRSLRRAPGTPGYDAISDVTDYDAHYRADPYAEAGLHHPECPEHLGPMCWTSRVGRIVILPKNGTISVRLANVGTNPNPDAPVQLRTPWGVFSGSVGVDCWAETVISLPDHTSPDFPVTVEVVVDRPFTPQRYRLSEDIRELGVMVSLDGVTPMPNPYRNQQLPAIGPRLRLGHEPTPLAYA